MNQSQQFEVRHRWQPRSAGPSQDKVGFRVIRARLDPEADQSLMVQVRSSCGKQSEGPNFSQLRTMINRAR